MNLFLSNRRRSLITRRPAVSDARSLRAGETTENEVVVLDSALACDCRAIRRNPSCSLCVSSTRKKSYWSNPEKFRNLSKGWADENREQKRARRRAHYRKHPKRYKKQAATWKKANPEVMRDYAKSAQQRLPGWVVRNRIRDRGRFSGRKGVRIFLSGMHVPDHIVECKRQILLEKRDA